MQLENKMEQSKLCKSKKGGSRKGSGAKSRYGEPTTTIAFRVPISRVKHVKDLMRGLLDAWSSL